MVGEEFKTHNGQNRFYTSVEDSHITGVSSNSDKRNDRLFSKHLSFTKVY